MRLSIGALSLLALGTALSMFGSDIFYTIDSTSGSPGFTGSFEYDTTAQDFVSLIVTWDTLTYDLTSSANSPTITDTPTCAGGFTGAEASFNFLTTCTGLWNAGGDPSNFNFTSQVGPGMFPAIIISADAPGDVSSPGDASVADSTFQATQSSVPEPATYYLMLIAMGCLMLKWIRSNRRAASFSK